MLLRFLHKHLDLNAEWKLHLSFPQKRWIIVGPAWGKTTNMNKKLFTL